MLVLKKNVHKPGHFQYTIHYDGKSFSCPWTQKGFTSYYMHFSSFKIFSHFYLVSAIWHHISLLRLLPKSYFKISTFQPNFLCSSSFKPRPQKPETQSMAALQLSIIFTCGQITFCQPLICLPINYMACLQILQMPLYVRAHNLVDFMLFFNS